MKTKSLKIVLALEAVVCIVLALFGRQMDEGLLLALSFPFQQIAFGLRWLSLSGTAGNVVAILLYAFLCLTPAFFFLYYRRKKQLHGENWLLPLLSILLLWALYLMINPVCLSIPLLQSTGNSISLVNAIMGSVLYSVLVAYLVLRLFRRVSNGEATDILDYLKWLMVAMCLVLVFAIFAQGLSSIFGAIDTLRAGNTASPFWDYGADAGQSLSASEIVVILQQLLVLLPYGLDIWILFVGFPLMDALKADIYSDEAMVQTARLIQLCKQSIGAIMLSQIALNVLQLFAASTLLSLHYTLTLPLGSIVFVLLALLLAKYLEQGKALKADNDMFI